jgi:hypothetical protein
MKYYKLVFVFLFIGCCKPSSLITYLLKNNTTEIITIVAYKWGLKKANPIVIKSKETVKFETWGGLNLPITINADSLVIIKNDIVIATHINFFLPQYKTSLLPRDSNFYNIETFKSKIIKHNRCSDWAEFSFTFN